MFNCRMKIAIITVMLMAAFFCSKSEEEKKELAVKRKIDSLKPKITNILIDPQAPISTSFIRAVPRLENPARAQSVTFTYQWYLNGEPVPGGVKQQLEEKKKKGIPSTARLLHPGVNSQQRKLKAIK